MLFVCFVCLLSRFWRFFTVFSGPWAARPDFWLMPRWEPQRALSGLPTRGERMNKYGPLLLMGLLWVLSLF